MRDDGEIIIYLHNGTERDFEDDITISATHNYTLEMVMSSDVMQSLHQTAHR